MKTTWYTATAISAVALMLSAATVVAAGNAANHSSQPAASPATTSASADWSSRHTMEGEITRIDQKKGTVSVKTAEGTMDLHFPPSALSSLKKGDRVAVELAMKPEGGAASPATKSDMGKSPDKSSTGGAKSGDRKY